MHRVMAESSDDTYGISDSLWEQIEPLLPPEPPKPKGGRPRMDDRKAMQAILYMLRSGCKLGGIPRSLGAPSTIRKRFREWQELGVFQRMWRAGLLTYDEMRALVWYGNRVAQGRREKGASARRRERESSVPLARSKS